MSPLNQNHNLSFEVRLLILRTTFYGCMAKQGRVKENILISFGLTQVSIQYNIPVISTPSIDAYFNYRVTQLNL